MAVLKHGTKHQRHGNHLHSNTEQHKAAAVSRTAVSTAARHTVISEPGSGWTIDPSIQNRLEDRMLQLGDDSCSSSPGQAAAGALGNASDGPFSGGSHVRLCAGQCWLLLPLTARVDAACQHTHVPAGHDRQYTTDSTTVCLGAAARLVANICRLCHLVGK